VVRFQTFDDDVLHAGKQLGLVNRHDVGFDARNAVATTLNYLKNGSVLARVANLTDLSVTLSAGVIMASFQPLTLIDGCRFNGVSL